MNPGTHTEYPAATTTVQEENELVRVVRWHFPPGTATGWHIHGHDYVVVPTIGGTLSIAAPGGQMGEFKIVASESYFRRAGVEHNVINLSNAVVEFVEIEFLNG